MTIETPNNPRALPARELAKAAAEVHSDVEAAESLEEAVRLSTATGAANVMCSGTQAAEYSVIEGLIPKVVFGRL